MNETSESVEARLRAARVLLKEFRFERYSNIIIAWVAFGFLVTLSLMLVISQDFDWAKLGGVIGSGGAITAACGRLLSVFKTIVNAVFGQPRGD